MATHASKPVSNIAVAFANQSPSSNAPAPPHGGLASAPAHTGHLPTPPSSLSPTLPAHKRRAGMPLAGRLHTPPHGDMDIDLQDALEHAAAQDQPASALSKEALAGLDATRQITAVMLAKHHLPGILLGHGAMPIREMMAHLNDTVPGFSRLPSAKSRRLIVAALEHRAGGGLHGEVKFEKVGWGRWSVAGQSSPSGQGLPIGGKGSARHGHTPPASVDSTNGQQVSKNMRYERDMYSGSWAAQSPDSHEEEMADAMSLDGSEDPSNSDASNMDLEDDLNDETDEEDWSAIGPQHFRPKLRNTRPVYRDYNYLSRITSARQRAASSQAHSMPPVTGKTRSVTTPFSASRANNTGSLNASSGAMGSGGQTAERDAIEALIAMGSM